MVEPSQTARGQAWLQNFDEEEQTAARLLLDGLDLVGQDRLRVGLNDLTLKLAGELPGPIALVPVRKMAPGQSYYKGDKNSKAQLLLSNSFPGSEAVVANLAGGLRRERGPRGEFVASPSLLNMREAKCRTVLFLEDFSGSGKRVLDFLEAFCRHRTIKSWLSYRIISIHVAAFAMTAKAEERLKKRLGDDRVHYHQICPTFAARPWTARELAEVEALCLKYYSPRSSAGPYGFLESRALMAFSHSVPNNIPPILWQRDTPMVRSWSPFFIENAVPPELSFLFGQGDPNQRTEEALVRLGQLRMASGGWRDLTDGDTVKVMLFLAALARRPRSLSKVSELTGLSSDEMARILMVCRRWGLVGSTLRLSDSGLRELAHAKAIRLREETVTLRGSVESYYPRSLRVGR